jgi:hypothetical protein
MESKLNLSQDVSAIASEFKRNLSSSCVYTEAEKSELLDEFDSLMRDSTE